jgi:hypothetical protein
MRARTKDPKFLAQVTEPQVFVNASYPWAPVPVKHGLITALKSAEPHIAKTNAETGWARLQVYDPVNFPPDNVNDLLYLRFWWPQH